MNNNRVRMLIGIAMLPALLILVYACSVVSMLSQMLYQYSLLRLVQSPLGILAAALNLLAVFTAMLTLLHLYLLANHKQPLSNAETLKLLSASLWLSIPAFLLAVWATLNSSSTVMGLLLVLAQIVGIVLRIAARSMLKKEEQV
ncbi:MAG: hypothetical protein ACI4LE_02395 [Faecalibacterium sp.]